MSNPAFPIPESNQTTDKGLTKLEYGALQIAAAMCSTGAGESLPSSGDRHEIARRSVLIASAVLAEANK